MLLVRCRLLPFGFPWFELLELTELEEAEASPLA